MKFDLTDREIELLMGCIGTNIETIKRRHTAADPMIAELIEELFELETDLREALHRKDDGWGDADDPGLVICDAETRLFNAGVEAREKMKATSRAAGRRALNFVGQSDDDTEAQGVDGWNPDDPKNW